jgi:hypothetical protein
MVFGTYHGVQLCPLVIVHASEAAIVVLTATPELELARNGELDASKTGVFTQRICLLITVRESEIEVSHL